MLNKFITPPPGHGLLAVAWIVVLVLSGACSLFAAPAPSVQINEIMAAAHYAIADEDGEYVDWVELHNTGADAVNLDGWFLTDDELDLAKWRFPSVQIAPGGYLVVFASGKNRTLPGGSLHTNFNLDQDGDYLALVRPNGVIEDKLAHFPSQIPDVAYDRAGNFLLYPTPGSANRNDALAIASAPVLSQPHGFSAGPFTLTMTSATPGALIRFTVDGSEPSLTNGYVYRGPIPIRGTTVVRAIALKEPQLPSPIVTRSFLFTADVIRQSPNGRPPAGWPARWGKDHAVDYGMDPQIVNSRVVRRTIPNDLKTIPTLSLVMDLKDLFSGDRGIYANPQRKGDDWERPMSLEWIDPAGTTGFQVNGGVRIRGGASRDTNNPKHSFHFVFRREYGAAELEFPVFGEVGARRFDKFDLRCAQTNSWHFWVDERTDFIRDQFSRDTQIAMGHPAARGDFFHLYINGQYWGLYNTQEKPDATFGEAYFGGSQDDYDWIKYDNDGGQTMANDGTFAAWCRLCEFGAKGFANDDAYFQVQGLNPDGTRNGGYERLLDVDNLIDYMILGIYVAAMDNPHGGGAQNNWSGIRHRGGDFGFRFFAHDFEFSLADKTDDLLEDEPVEVSEHFLTPSNVNPWHFWQALRLNPEFRLRVADRLQKHFLGNGALTPDASAERFKVRMQEIDRAVVGESARWGDASPDRRSRPFKREDWLAACNEHLLQDYFPERSGIVLQQFRDANLFPNIVGPAFTPNAAAIAAGETVQITNPNERGVVYFTIDGSDPRQIGGAVAPSAQQYSDPLALEKRTRIRARVKDGDVWSAITEAEFAVGIDYSALRLTELHYNPPAVGDVLGDEFEFVELHNAGSAILDLSGFSFTAGITYTFPPNSVAAPESYLVLVRNAAKFAEAYPAVPIAGVYTGRLDNAGERLTLSTSGGVPVVSFAYSDRAPWPPAGDGLGYSIVYAKGRSFTDGDNWRASAHLGGSPGSADPEPARHGRIVVNEILVRPDSGSQRIELFNGTDEPVDISGWWLTNDLSAPKKFRIPAGTVVSPNGFVVFAGENFSSAPGPSGMLSFAATGDSVWIIAANPAGEPTGYVHGFTFDASPVGVPFIRWINSSGDEQFPLASEPTFGSANAAPMLAPLRITEIQYRPIAGDMEWVELTNDTLAPISLSNWRLDGLRFTFGAGAQIPGKGVAFVVSGDPVLFREKYGIDESIPVYGPAPGTLQDNGEEVALRKPSDLDPGAFVTVERVRYNDKEPWPVWSPSEGYSLQRITTASYGDDPQAWLAGKPSYGKETELRAPPRVRLVEPLRGTSFPSPAAIRFRADASDIDGVVQQVEFLFDGEKVGEVTTAPWEFVWSGGSGGLHDLSARVTDNSGATAVSEPVTVRIDDPNRGMGTGLRAEYYAGSAFEGEPVVRIDPEIDLRWSEQPPIAGIPKGPTSIRWTGKFVSRKTGEYNFTIRTRGNVRLWIDGELQIDSWEEELLGEPSAFVFLDAGAVHDLRLEYRTMANKGAVAFLWGEPFTPDLVIIPQDRLYTPDQDPKAFGVITAEELPGALRGTVYRTELRSVGGKAPVSWSWEPLAEQVLPGGVTLHSDGVITGIPQEGGEFRFTARAVDQEGKSAQRAFILRIDDRRQDAKPRLSLISPRQNARLLEGNVALRGAAQASPGRSIVGLLYSVNGSRWKPYSVNSVFNFLLSEADNLRPGENFVRLKARDNQGQESIVIERRFTHAVFRPLTVAIEGRGTVTPGFNGQSRREVGRLYTVRATPAPGWYFAEWSGAVYSNRPSLTFVMDEDTSLTAVFRRNLFPSRAGTYAGLLVNGESPQSWDQGSAVVRLMRQGGFTASIRLGAERFSLKGRIERQTGVYYTTVIGTDDTVYDISLSIDAFSSPTQVGVAISWAKDDLFYGAFGSLGRAEFHAQRRPFTAAGQYTLVLSHGDTPAPAGDGYGLVSVDRAGRVRIVGELADGTAWSAAAPVTNLKTAPIDTMLYGGKGMISGNLSLPELKETNEWLWIKQPQAGGVYYPQGFATSVSARLSPYTPPARGSRAIQLSTAELRLTNGNLVEAILEPGILSEQNTFTLTSANPYQLQLQINPATGRVSGSFMHPVTNSVRSLQGVVEQGKASIRGFFLGNDTGGLLEVHPTP